MTKNQLNCIACLIFGMGFMILSYLMTMSEKVSLWVPNGMMLLGLVHIIFAGIFNRDQKYDGYGKPQ